MKNTNGTAKNGNGTVRMIGVIIAFVLALSTSVYTVGGVSAKTDSLDRRVERCENRDDAMVKDIAEIKAGVKLLLKKGKEN
jgi:hypothetical protein